MPAESQTGIRTLALDHGTVAVLRRSGPASGAGDFLFAKPSGEPLSPGYVTHMFLRLVTECDLPPVRFHDLRHGAASLSLAAGNDGGFMSRAAAEQAGGYWLGHGVEANGSLITVGQ